jgi:uncharacterized protein
VATDLGAAAKWYRKAAEAGDAFGQKHLGFMYAYGLGVEKGYGEARNWGRKAAANGNWEAIQDLKRLGQN